MSTAAGLTGSFFEKGLTDDEKKLLCLRARYAGLTFCGCAHAVFLSELLHSLRRYKLVAGVTNSSPRELLSLQLLDTSLLQHTSIKRMARYQTSAKLKGMLKRCIIGSKNAARDSCVPGGHGDLCVGILGLGNLGKQLLLSLLKKTRIKPTQIKISTRNPESAEECVPTEVECFFDNRRLAAWADVLFLCCLPSHLQRICADLRSRLPKHCLVYSFTTVPAASIAERLGHNFVLRPQYQLEAFDTSDLWLSSSHLAAALSDPSLIEASCPLTLKGGITLGLNWICGVLYSLLNICTSACLGSSEALSLINSIFTEKRINNEPLNAQSFISSSGASVLDRNESFPWISLVDTQTKETPLLRFVKSSKSVQQCICAAYKSYLGRTIN